MNKPYKKPETAFILAAGEGTRMRPLTNSVPKPMVQLDGKSIIDYTIDKLMEVGIKKIIVNSYYLATVLEEHLQHKDNIVISREDDLLDTGGGVKNALTLIDAESFYLINGDAFWVDTNSNALEALAEAWDPDKMDILLLLQPIDRMKLTQGVGDYTLDDNKKPIRKIDQSGELMFTGIRITKANIFKNTPEGKFSYMQLMDDAERINKLSAVIYDGDWHHISTPQDLENVNFHISNKKTGCH